MDKREIRNTLEGRNPDGTYKACLIGEIFLCEDITVQNAIPRKISTDDDGYFSNQVYFKFEEHDGYVQADLHFKSSESEEMKRIWKSLETYGQLMDIHQDDDIQPIYKMTFMPIYEGVRGYIEGYLPIFWAVQPSNFSEKNDSIRVLFSSENFVYISVDPISEEVDNKNAEVQ